MVTVTEVMDGWNNDQLAEATVVIIDWFSKQGRTAYELVLDLQPDPAAVGEFASWVEELAGEAGCNG